MDDPGQGISPGGGGGGGKSGYPAKEETVPTESQFHENPKTIPSIFNYSGAWLVDDKVKSVIESLEPGVHQFFPIKLLRVNGEVAEERWVLNICQRVDGVEPEKSDLKIKRRPADELITSIMPYAAKRKVVLVERVIKGHHLWIDKRYIGSTTFLSVELREAFKAAGVTGGHFEKVEAV